MNTRFLYFNRKNDLSKLFVTSVIIILSVCNTTAFAQKQKYDFNDKEGLRKFLRQESVVKGQLNLHRLGLTISDTIGWDKSEDWVDSVYKLTWNNSNPKRLTHIGGIGSFDTVLIGNRVYRTRGWDMKGIQGDLDASHWQMLEYLDIHNSTDYLSSTSRQVDSLMNRINSLKLGTSLCTLICEAIGLKSLIGNLPNIERLAARYNCLSDVNLTNTPEKFTDFSGGGQTVSLMMCRNRDATSSRGNISLNNPLFFNTDGILIPSDSISYTRNTLTDKRKTTTWGSICFIAETGATQKRIGGVINLEPLRINKKEQ